MSTSRVKTTLAALAELVGGQVCGDATTQIGGAETLRAAGPNEITLADNPALAQGLAASLAAAAIIHADVPCKDKPSIVVEDVRAAFAQVVAHFRPVRPSCRVGVCPDAHISPTAKLGQGIDVHPGATIGDDVTIGSGSIIHSGVRIMAGCVIGSQVTLFPNVVLYENTQIGDRSIIHAGAVLGGYGFGFELLDGKHQLCDQLGYVKIGTEVEIGACTSIDRGTYGATTIGEGTKIDNMVQIGHNCHIGKHNLLCSQVGIAGSTSTGDYVVMAGQVGVRDHVHIGKGAVLGSKSGVSNDVPEETVMLGAPATPLRRQKVQIAAIAKLPEMRKQFRAMQRQLAMLEQQLDHAPAPQNSKEHAA